MGAVADAIRAAGGDRTAIYLTSRGMTNEVYYAAAKAARAMGIANIDSAARTCHAPSTVGLKQTIGVAASTCSMQDVLDTDLIVLWGTNVANNQPVFTKYLYLARKRGARVVVVNPYLEPGLERYWVPSNVESALFGTQAVRPPRAGPPGGRRRLRQRRAPARSIERDAVDHEWIAAHTEGWDELVAHLAHARPRPRCWRRPASTRRRSSASSTSTPAPAARCSSGAWASPSTPTASRACRRSSTSASPAATSAATAPG